MATLGTLVVVPLVLVVVLSRMFFVVLPMVRVRVGVGVVWVMRRVERKLLQWPSKCATEEIGDFKGLSLESVASSARVVLSSSFSSRWTSSVGNWKPCYGVRPVGDGVSKA